MAGYWIMLRDRPARPGDPGAAGPSEGSPATASAALAELLGCRRCWWASDAVTTAQAALRALGSEPGEDSLHVVGPASWIERALENAGLRRRELDVDPDTLAPAWPADRHGLFVVDHRHGVPAPAPPGVPAGRILEDATTALGGTLHGRPVGALGRAAIVVLGTPLFPRSTGAVIATAHTDIANDLHRETTLTSLDDADDAALLADISQVAERIDAIGAAAAVYDSAWRGKNLELRRIQPPPGAMPSGAEYVIGVPNPDGLAAALAAEGVESRRPLNARLERVITGDGGLFPGARRFYSQALQLPCHPGLDVGELLFVADVIVRHVRALHD